MSYLDSTSTDHLIPHGTPVRCVLQGCQRIRHAGPQRKLQYELRFTVEDSKYAGRTITRNLWDTANGLKVLHDDCELLDIGHVEELCYPLPRPVIVDGVVAISEYQGVKKNELCRIVRRVYPETDLANPASSQPQDEPFADAF